MFLMAELNFNVIVTNSFDELDRTSTGAHAPKAKNIHMLSHRAYWPLLQNGLNCNGDLLYWIESR